VKYNISKRKKQPFSFEESCLQIQLLAIESAVQEQKDRKTLTNQAFFNKISSVSDYEGKKDEPLRFQRVGGCCEPAGGLRV